MNLHRAKKLFPHPNIFITEFVKELSLPALKTYKYRNKQKNYHRRSHIETKETKIENLQAGEVENDSSVEPRTRAMNKRKKKIPEDFFSLKTKEKYYILRSFEKSH